MKCLKLAIMNTYKFSRYLKHKKIVSNEHLWRVDNLSLELENLLRI